MGACCLRGPFPGCHAALSACCLSLWGLMPAVPIVQHRKTKKEELEEQAGTIKAKAKRFGNWFGGKAAETKDAAADNLSKATVRCPASCHPPPSSQTGTLTGSKVKAPSVFQTSPLPLLAVCRPPHFGSVVGPTWRGMATDFLGTERLHPVLLLPNRGVDAAWVSACGLGGDCRQDGGCGAPPGRCCPWCQGECAEEPLGVLPLWLRRSRQCPMFVREPGELSWASQYICDFERARASTHVVLESYCAPNTYEGNTRPGVGHKGRALLL